MAKDPAFLFYSKDWLEGTADMTATEKGVYVDLLAYQHQRKELPNDTERLARLVRMPHSEFLKVWKFLSIKFETNGDGILNRKLSLVMDERAEKGKKNRISGTFAAVLRQMDLSKKQYKYLKAEFNIVDFYSVSADSLSERITEWITERLLQWSKSIKDGNGNGTGFKNNGTGEIVKYAQLFSDKLIDENFGEHWQKWIEFNDERGTPITPIQAKVQLEYLASIENPVEKIELSIKNNWKGLQYGISQGSSKRSKNYVSPEQVRDDFNKAF